MFVAWRYSREEMFHDLLPNHPQMNVREFNDILIYRPDKSENFRRTYERAIDYGVIPRPNFDRLVSEGLHDDVEFPQTRAFDVFVDLLFAANIRNLLEPEQGEDEPTVDNKEEGG